MKNDKFDLGMIYSSEYLNRPTQVEDWDRIKEVYNNYIQNDPGKSVIPKIIHQIWIGGELPEKQKKACRDIQVACNENGWEYKLWRDSDVAELGEFKNKELYDKKVKRLSEFKVQPSNMFFKQPDTDKVRKLKKDIKNPKYIKILIGVFE